MNTAIKKILVVDDNIDLSEVLAILLSSEGYDVTTVGNGRAALQQVEIERPDIIVSDIRMPIMDGLAMRDKLHAHPETRDIPIVFISGMVPDGRLIEPRPLQKPVKFDELLAQVSRILRDDGNPAK